MKQKTKELTREEFMRYCREKDIIPCILTDTKGEKGVHGCEHCKDNLMFARKNKLNKVIQRIDGWDIIGVVSKNG